MLCLFSLDDVTNCSKLSRFARAGGPTPAESTFTPHHAPHPATGTCPAQYGRSVGRMMLLLACFHHGTRSAPLEGNTANPGCRGYCQWQNADRHTGCRHQPAFNSAYLDPSWLAGR